MRRHDADRGIADRDGEHLSGPAGWPASLADSDERAHQRAHHVVAERVRHHPRDQDPVMVAMPVQGTQRPDGGRSFPAAAEGREIVLAQDGQRRLVHAGEIEPPEVPQRVVPAQRVRGRRVVADAIGVAAPQRGETRVEPVGRPARGPDADIGRKHPG